MLLYSKTLLFFTEPRFFLSEAAIFGFWCFIGTYDVTKPGISQIPGLPKLSRDVKKIIPFF